MNKIFGIGLSKTGTNSLCEALNHLGFSTIHYPGPDIIGQAAKVDAIADIPTVRYYKLLDERFSGSKFILTLRPIDDWLRSVESHYERRPPSTLNAWGRECREAVYGSVEFNRDLFAKKYMAHSDDVFAYFADRREDLILLNVFTDKDPWRILVNGLRLDVPIPAMAFPRSNVDPKKQSKVDVVYPFYNSGSHDELKYSMRSMEENFTSLRNIWVIGDKPDWASDQVQYIPYDHIRTLPSNEYSKGRNICEKMLRAALTPEVSTDFVYAGDDHYLLRPWSLEDFTRTVLVREDLNNFPKEFLDPKTRPWVNLNEWQTALWETYDKMKLFGHYGWNYETHTPKLINKVKLIKTFAQYGIGEGKLIWHSAYFNMHWKLKTGISSEQSNIKAGFYKTYTPEEIIAMMTPATFLNHNDKGLTDYLKAAIMKRFPEKSRYER